MSQKGLESHSRILDLEACRAHLAHAARPFYRGRIDIVSGVIVEAVGVPAALGDVCRINRGPLGSIDAEVVGFRGSSTLLMPHGELTGIAPRQSVVSLGRPFEVQLSDELLGRMLDGFGRPADGGPALSTTGARIPTRRDAPSPLSRVPITTPLQTGVRVLDGLATLGQGQRLGIFAGSGVGKSTLLGQITRGTNADLVVCCLVGERGREVRGFLEDVLGEEGRRKSITVVATSERAPIERYTAPFVAVTIAEYFRDQGMNVLFVMDSVTRFAAACREIGLAAGEPPTVRGYPPSFFATVPKLVERMGCTGEGSITGLLTVLLEGDDPNEPVADTVRSLLDGHLMLTRELAQANHYPAVDVLNSLSRLMPSLADEEHIRAAGTIRGLLSAYRDGRDLVDVGAYHPGANERLDRALLAMPAIEAFLQQPVGHSTSFAETKEMLVLVANSVAAAAGGAT